MILNLLSEADVEILDEFATDSEVSCANTFRNKDFLVHKTSERRYSRL